MRDNSQNFIWKLWTDSWCSDSNYFIWGPSNHLQVIWGLFIFSARASTLALEQDHNQYTIHFNPYWALSWLNALLCFRSLLTRAAIVQLFARVIGCLQFNDECIQANPSLGSVRGKSNDPNWVDWSWHVKMIYNMSGLLLYLGSKPIISLRNPIFFYWFLKCSMSHIFFMHAWKAILNLPTSSLHLCSPFQQNR